MGLVLVGLGVVFTGISYGWGFFGIRLGLSSGLAFFVEIDITLNAIEYVCLEIGLLLILWGILRLLPPVRPWSRAGPILLLGGALVVAGLNLADVVLVSVTYPPPQIQIPDWAAYLISGGLIAGYLVAALGLLLSLFAVAKGVVLQTSAAPGLPRA